MTQDTILTIRLGATGTYLVSGKDGYLLIDGGFRGWDRWFFMRLKMAGIRPEQIRLAVITHVHFDHVGTLQAVADRCRCPGPYTQRKPSCWRPERLLSRPEQTGREK